MTLARRIASELAQPAWPSTRSSQTGRCGATASSTAAVGNAPPGPEALVPVPAGDPRVAGVGVDPRLDPAGDLVERRDPAQVELFLAGPERFHVAVGVDQARAWRRRRAAR